MLLNGSLLKSAGREARYFVYGLHVACNLSLPYAQPCAARSAPADVTVDVCRYPGDVPPGAYTDMVSQGYERTEGPAAHMLWFAEQGRTEIHISDDARQIWVRWHRAILEDIAPLLLGQGLSIASRIQGHLTLHGAAFNISGQAACILGPSGAGKSTLACQLAADGCAMLSDDVIALRRRRGGGYDVQRGFPHLKAWPATVAAFDLPAQSSPLVHERTDKRMVSLGQGNAEGPWQFQPTPLPLGGFFILEPRRSDLIAPEIIPLATQDAARLLLLNRSSDLYDLGPGVAAREFAAVIDLVQCAPAWKLALPDGFEALPQATGVIEQTLAQGAY